MTIEEMSARLEKVERQNRWMRAGGIAALVLAAAGAAMGQAVPAPKVIQAERFEVVDSKGKSRVSIGAAEDGSSGLEISDNKGKPRVAVGAFTNGCVGLILYDGDGKRRTEISVLQDGSPVLRLCDKEEKDRAALAVHPDGCPGFGLLDKEEQSRMGFALAVDGAPAIMLSDRRGKDRVTLELIAESPLLGLSDSKGTVRVQLVADDKETQGLYVFDKDGKLLEGRPK